MLLVLSAVPAQQDQPSNESHLASSESESGWGAGGTGNGAGDWRAAGGAALIMMPVMGPTLARRLPRPVAKLPVAAKPDSGCTDEVTSGAEAGFPGEAAIMTMSAQGRATRTGRGPLRVMQTASRVHTTGREAPDSDSDRRPGLTDPPTPREPGLSAYGPLV